RRRKWVGARFLQRHCRTSWYVTANAMRDLQRRNCGRRAVLHGHRRGRYDGQDARYRQAGPWVSLARHRAAHVLRSVRARPLECRGFATCKADFSLRNAMKTSIAQDASKVPEVTLAFWIIKIAATTLGETGGDAVSMSMGLGYLVSTGIFAALFAVAVVAQMRARQYHPFIYWATIVATTTVGTTLADF